MMLENTFSRLPHKVKALIPEANIEYYRATNAMHCEVGSPGGSKFLDLPNIFSVLEKDGHRIADAVARREDDRAIFASAGVPIEKLLPAKKEAHHPTGMPEALYYHIGEVRGKLGIIKLSALGKNERVLVRREKSLKDTSGRETVPCSYTAIRGKFDNLPDTDHATVIIGYAAVSGSQPELWTVHPGPPIRSVLGDFLPGSEALEAPRAGVRQRAMVVTVGDLLASEAFAPDDHIKIMAGNFDSVLKQYEIVS